MMPVYLDHHATTPVDPRALEAMLPFFTEHHGNAASDHEHGAIAHRAIEDARTAISDLLRARTNEVIFTSGATESNNLAIIGAAQANEAIGKHIITSQIEHPAVLDACQHLEKHGWDVTYLQPDKYGLHTADQVRDVLREDTVLVSIMMANNEIGTIQPIREIGALLEERTTLFHTDATQAITWVPANVDELGVDLLSMSSHKMYGPKGIGALYVRRKPRRVRVLPQVLGGGHERGLRSGTPNVTGIVGFGAAAKLVADERDSDAERASELRDALHSTLSSNLQDVVLHGHENRRLPNNLNIAFKGVEARSLLNAVSTQLSISTGSACSSSEVEPSHVLLAILENEEEAHESVRIGIGRFTTQEDIQVAGNALENAVKRLRTFANL